MKSAHFFFVDDLGHFISNLESRRYMRSYSDDGTRRSIYYSRTLSNAIVKYYNYEEIHEEGPLRIGVTYDLISEGKPLVVLTKKLKALNTKYRQSLPGRKTKREASEKVREKRWADIQHFLHQHGDLIECFKYQADNRLTEGNHSFNLEIASRPKEQAVCFEFIKALVDAYAPHGIVRARREPDVPRKQRNGWIKRYAELHKRRGWSPLEISKEIQRELREGTWNERSRLQYNLAQNTICRIAGLKLHPHAHQSTMN